MNIKRMHAEIKLRMNKMNSNHKKDLPTAYIDDFLNDAQEELIEICYSGNNRKKYPLGFEMNQSRIDLLSTLVISEEAVAVTLVSTGIYKINLNGLTNKYDHFLNGAVATSCGKMFIEIVRHNEIDTLLLNENRKPSGIWKRCLGVFATDVSSNKCIYLYTDGVFTISGATITYLKRAKKMFFGGYDTLEFTNGDNTAPAVATPAISTELPDVGTVHSNVVDIAIQLMSIALEDPNKLQLVEEKLTRTL